MGKELLRRASSVGILILLVTSILTLIFSIETARAEPGTIYIHADGNVAPSNAPIQRNGDLYALTDNVTSGYAELAGIVIERNNIVLDCAGYTLIGFVSPRFRPTTGIVLSNMNNVTIRNANVRDFDFGISLDSSSNNNINANNITANREYGILLVQSFSNVIVNNDVTANGLCGILLHYSSSNSFHNNTIARNWYNFGIFGDLPDFINNVDMSNTVNGKPICYWINQHDNSVPVDSGTVYLVNCTSITVQNLNLSQTMEGIALVSTTDSRITYNNITGNDFGVFIVNSSNNSCASNEIVGNVCGIDLRSSPNNNISGNNIASNNDAIYLDSSSNNNITANNITANGAFGIYLDLSSSNTIYHNNFRNNRSQVHVETSEDVWDEGFPLGGNYWSDNNGTDFYKGQYQNETGSDGIGDIPYTIDENNTDRYPLMQLYVPPVGDLNWDGIVNILDANQAASVFGLHAGDPGWNEQVDFNGDGVVNILDVIILARNFGKHYP